MKVNSLVFSLSVITAYNTTSRHISSLSRLHNLESSLGPQVSTQVLWT